MLEYEVLTGPKYELQPEPGRFTMIVWGMLPQFHSERNPYAGDPPLSMAVGFAQCLGEFPLAFLVYGNAPKGPQNFEFGRMYYCPSLEEMADAEPIQGGFTISPNYDGVWSSYEIDQPQNLDGVKFSDEPLFTWQFEDTMICLTGVNPGELSRLTAAIRPVRGEDVTLPGGLTQLVTSIAKYVVWFGDDGNAAIIDGDQRFLPEAVSSLSRFAAEFKEKYEGYEMAWSEDERCLSVGLPKPQFSSEP